MRHYCKNAQNAQGTEDDKDKSGWDTAMEGYENSMDVDHVFERFARRVGREGAQCIRYTIITITFLDVFLSRPFTRYELKGVPLPYAHEARARSRRRTGSGMTTDSGPSPRRHRSTHQPRVTVGL